MLLHMRPHFIFSVLFAIALALVAASNDIKKRMLFVIPTLIFFYLALISLGIEFEKDSRKAWQKKEKKLVEETYMRFFNKGKTCQKEK